MRPGRKQPPAAGHDRAAAKLDEYNQQLEERGRQLDKALAHVETLVAHDPLTGVLSRRAVMAQADHLLVEAVAGSHSVWPCWIWIISNPSMTVWSSGW
jgi:PleD family two-component response regulator